MKLNNQQFVEVFDVGEINKVKSNPMDNDLNLIEDRMFDLDNKTKLCVQHFIYSVIKHGKQRHGNYKN